MDIPESIKKADETLRRELKKIRYTELSDYFHCENQEDLIRAINESSLDEIMEKLVDLKNDIDGLKQALISSAQKSANKGAVGAFNSQEAVESITDLIDRKEMLYQKLRDIHEINLLFSVYSKQAANKKEREEIVNKDIIELIQFINDTHNNNEGYLNVTGDLAPQVFMGGKCYYYAEILKKFYHEGELVFENTDGPHVAFRLNGEVYDSTGRKSKEEAKEFHPIEGEDWTWIEQVVLPQNKDDRDAMEQFVENIYNEVLEQYYSKEPETGKVPKA